MGVGVQGSDTTIRLKEILIYTKKPKETASFYTDLLGLEVAHKEGEDMIWLALPGNEASLFLHKSDEDFPESSSVQLVFQVPNVEALVRRIKEAGLSVIREPQKQPYGVLEASVCDPEGRVVWLVENIQ